MKKVIIAVLLATFIGTGAFAQISLGFSGALYYFEDKDIPTVIQDFQTGEGVFYGPFAEIVLDNFGVGMGFNYSKYTDTLIVGVPESAIDFMYGDLTLYGTYHLFGGKAFLDPFAELGVGYSFNDYFSAEDDTDTNNPLAASVYYFGGFGLGVNVGSVGGFMKISYNKNSETPVYMKDENGDDMEFLGEKIELPEFTMFPVKFTLGVKFIL